MHTYGSDAFQQAAERLLNLVSTYMKGKAVFLGRTTADTFSVLKLKNDDPGLVIPDEVIIPLNESICNLIFAHRRPVKIDDMRERPDVSCLGIVQHTHMASYLGVPIFYRDGEVFGTLCAAGSTAAQFREEDIQFFQGLAEFFSYVLELEELTKHDSLTGLYNRDYLYRYFRKQEHGSGAILFLDLDGFKAVNDTLGHEAGDRVLQAVARCITSVLRPGDIPIRLGGDEFVIALVQRTRAEAEMCAKQLLQAVQGLALFGDKTRISLSIGIAMYSDNEKEIQELVQCADAAMYQAKEQGKNQYAFYHG